MIKRKGKIRMIKIKNDPIEMVLETFVEMYPKVAKKINEIYYADFVGNEKIMTSHFEDGIVIAIKTKKQNVYKIAENLKYELLKIAVDMDTHSQNFVKEIEKFNKKIERKNMSLFDY